MSRSPEYTQGKRAGIKWAITWLHQRASEMNDPHAKAVLDTAAFNMGVSAKRTDGATIEVSAETVNCGRGEMDISEQEWLASVIRPTVRDGNENLRAVGTVEIGDSVARFEDAIMFVQNGGRARRECWANVTEYTQSTPPMNVKRRWQIWVRDDVGGIIQGWGGSIGGTIDDNPVRDGTNYVPNNEDRTASDWELLRQELANRAV